MDGDDRQYNWICQQCNPVWVDTVNRVLVWMCIDHSERTGSAEAVLSLQIMNNESDNAFEKYKRFCVGKCRNSGYLG